MRFNPDDSVDVTSASVGSEKNKHVNNFIHFVTKSIPPP
jgi:hypothetical protein